MGLVWTTGNSGTGKSEVCGALTGKGYRTIDSIVLRQRRDEMRLARLVLQEK